MKINRSRLICVVSITVLCMAYCALAVVKVDLPVSKRFKVNKTIIIGKVTAVDPGKFLIEAATVEMLKGNPAPAKIRLLIPDGGPRNFITQAKVGEPVVVFVADSSVEIHLADTWLKASPSPSPKPGLWIIDNKDNNAAGKTFPGTTASLIRVLEDLKAGKQTLLDEYSGKVFSGGVKEIAKLDVSKPTFMLSADVNGDSKPDLIVGTPAGVRLFLATADGYADATEKWGLKAVPASSASVGDTTGSGKLDLILDDTLFLNTGEKFTVAAKAISLDTKVPVVASTLADISGGGKRDAALLLSDGQLVVFKNPGAASPVWPKLQSRKLAIAEKPEAAVFNDFAGEGKPSVLVVSKKSVATFPVEAKGGGAVEPTDFGRLTGDVLDRIKGFADGINHPAVTLLDVNGDHRPDLLITGDSAAMFMINRGFGAYLPDSDAGVELIAALAKAIPGDEAKSGVRAAVKNANGSDDLLVLLDNGRLFIVGNPAVVPAK